MADQGTTLLLEWAGGSRQYNVIWATFKAYHFLTTLFSRGMFTGLERSLVVVVVLFYSAMMMGRILVLPAGPNLLCT